MEVDNLTIEVSSEELEFFPEERSNEVRKSSSEHQPSGNCNIHDNRIRQNQRKRRGQRRKAKDFNQPFERSFGELFDRQFNRTFERKFFDNRQFTGAFIRAFDGANQVPLNKQRLATQIAYLVYRAILE